MSNFLHGVEIVEIDAGSRPITVARSSVIGVVGTAPDANSAQAATTIGEGNASLCFTAVKSGEAGNSIRIEITAAEAASSPLAVAVDGATVVITLATDGSSKPKSTAAEIVALCNKTTGFADLLTVETAEDGKGGVTEVGSYNLENGADESVPLNTPFLIAGSRAEAAKLGKRGTLPAAIDGIFDQIGTTTVVVRVPEGANDTDTLANVTGGTDANGHPLGIQCLLASESVLGVSPKILIAPGFTHNEALLTEMVPIAERMRSIVVAEGPNSTDQAAIDYRDKIGSDRVYLVDPGVKVFDTELKTEVTQSNSARVAGVIARTDDEIGFWASPSNKPINGIVGTARPIDFTLGDANARANLLNEHCITTIINKQGYRLWGNRSCSDDPKWAFLCVRRTADIIADSLQAAHMWAVDAATGNRFIEAVTASVNAFLRDLTARGAILGGECWANDELNTPDQLKQGHITFDFDFTPTYPAERITFRSTLTDIYFNKEAA